ncbi:Vestitone reductase [Morella rubra]|uniref:Vestitone reductase n=1 Tax=Morella rubra TaxID=262757 RepID=A0A6A1W257_9ROSI|nr:Vestitone reductase [Morella rubra]KAB1218963.1 Vestitone reductase [Morella rubra]
MDIDGKEPEDTVTKRAVEGTLGILKACLKSKTVKRVIYTSSAATILYNDRSLSVTDESTWSDLDICRNVELVSSSYLVSKIMTEKTALEFAKKNGLDLVTLVLPVVVGPFICPTIPSSVSLALAMVLGIRELYECLTYSYMVHVDDVASALLFLLDYPNARGSHFHRFPSCGHSNLSSMKLLDTGFKFKYRLEFDDMFEGAIQCCKEKGFL